MISFCPSGKWLMIVTTGSMKKCFVFTWFVQGGLHKKEIKLDFCKIFSILIFNRVKLGRAVGFMKYFASVVSWIFLSKTLIWNKIMLWLSNSLNLSNSLRISCTRSTNSLSRKTLLVRRIWSIRTRYLTTGVADLCWDTSNSRQVSNCDGVVNFKPSCGHWNLWSK